MIDDVESLKHELQRLLRGQLHAFGHGNIVVMQARVPQRRMRPRHVSDCEIVGLDESRRVEVKLGTRIPDVRIHSRHGLNPQEGYDASRVVE